jgi:uncharacterized membrane protein YfhO
VVLESYDSPWRAYAGEREVPVRKTVLGFMQVDPPPGTKELRLVFATPLENVVGWWVTLLGALVGAGWLVRDQRRRVIRDR